MYLRREFEGFYSEKKVVGLGIYRALEIRLD